MILGFWYQQLSEVAAVIPRTAIFTFPYLCSLKKSDLNELSSESRPAVPSIEIFLYIISFFENTY